MPNPNIKALGIDDTYIHMMLVAPPGFGKTVFLGTALKGLFLTTDPEGTVSALAMGSTCQEWRIPKWSTLNEAFRYLRDGGIEKDGWEFVMIDNISEAQNLGMVETMGNARQFNSKLDEFVPSQADYQRSQLMMKEMVKRFHDLPVHILWTAWRTTTEDQNGETMYAPGIHGQNGMLAETIAGYMNIVGYGEVLEDGDTRRIHFSQQAPWQGKDRFNVLGKKRDGLTVPEMERLVTAAMKKYKRGGTPVATPRATATKTAPATRRATTRKKAS